MQSSSVVARGSLRIGPKEIGVEPVAEHVQALGRDAEVAADLAGARVRRGDDRVEVPRHEALHADRVELDGAHGLRELRVAPERSAAIDGERVVDRRDDRQPERAQPEQAPAETLDVVHEVVADAAAQPRGRLAEGAHAERGGFGEEADAARAESPESQRRQYCGGILRAGRNAPSPEGTTCPRSGRRGVHGRRTRTASDRGRAARPALRRDARAAPARAPGTTDRSPDRRSACCRDTR